MKQRENPALEEAGDGSIQFDAKPKRKHKPAKSGGGGAGLGAMLSKLVRAVIFLALVGVLAYLVLMVYPRFKQDKEGYELISTVRDTVGSPSGQSKIGEWLEKHPDNKRLHQVLVEHFIETGEYEMAFSHADKMVAIGEKPGGEESIHDQIYAKIGTVMKWDFADNLAPDTGLRALDKVDRSEPETLLTFAQIALAREDYDKIDTYMAELGTDRPPYAWQVLQVKADLRRGEWAKVIRFCDAQVAAGNKNVEIVRLKKTAEARWRKERAEAQNK